MAYDGIDLTYEIQLLGLRMMFIPYWGEFPFPDNLEKARLVICENLINKTTKKEVRNRLILFSHFKPWQFERDRSFSLFFMKPVSPRIKQQYKWAREVYQNARIHSYEKLSDWLVDRYGKELKDASLKIELREIIFDYETEDFDLKTYKKFRSHIASEFAILSKKLPKDIIKRNRMLREFENKSRKLNPGFFSILCWEGIVFRGMVNNLVIKYCYRKIRNRLYTREEKRFYLLALLSLPVFEYKIPFHTPPFMSFFLLNDEVTELVIRVLIFRQKIDEHGVDINKKLENIWLSYLRNYRIHILLLQESEKEYYEDLKSRLCETWEESLVDKLENLLTEPRIEELPPFFMEDRKKTLMKNAGLTEIEARRSLKHHLEKKNFSQIAKEENTSHVATRESIGNGDDKIWNAYQAGKLSKKIIAEIFSREEKI